MAGVIQFGVAANINGSLGIGGASMGGGVGSGGPGGPGSPIGGFGGGMPMFGGYMKHLILGAGPGRGVSTIAHSPILVDAGPEGSGGGGSNGGPGGGDTGMGIDYDSWLGLFVTNSYTETTFTTSLFLDEAKTQPAGSFVITFPGPDGTFPYTFTSVYTITGGQFAGSHGSYVMTAESDTTGSMTYDYVWTGGGAGTGTSNWNAAQSTWSNRTTFTDGSWFQDQGAYSANGTGSSVTTNSLGYKYAYHYNADGSGGGRIEGPDAGLPATIVWTSMGVVTITYADGTTETFNPWYILDAVCDSVTDASGVVSTGPRKKK